MTSRYITGLLWPVFLLSIGCINAHAEFDVDSSQLRELSPVAGTMITAKNVNTFSFILDPDIAAMISRDWLTIPVGQITSFRPHAAYIQSTRQHGGRAKLGEPGQLLDYAGGRPFIGLPRNDDPRAGEKIAWNMRLMYNGDSARIPEMHWQLREMQSGNMARTMEFEALLMRFMHRHVVLPVPTVESSLQNVFGAFYMRATEAGDLTGMEVLAFIARDDIDQRKGWVYIPQLERSQSLASFSERESMFGSDYLAEDFFGYSGRIIDMKWKYVGTSFVLMPMYRYDQVVLTETQAAKSDYHFVHLTGRGNCFPNISWQVRKTYILEGTSTVENYPVSKRYMYIDAQTYFPAIVKLYDRENKLWKIGINGAAHPNSHVTDNKESGAPIFDVASMIDVQKERCTTIQALTLVNAPGIDVKDFNPNNLGSGRRIR